MSLTFGVDATPYVRPEFDWRGFFKTGWKPVMVVLVCCELGGIVGVFVAVFTGHDTAPAYAREEVSKQHAAVAQNYMAGYRAGQAAGRSHTRKEKAS